MADRGTLLVTFITAAGGCLLRVIVNTISSTPTRVAISISSTSIVHEASIINNYIFEQIYYHTFGGITDYR